MSTTCRTGRERESVRAIDHMVRPPSLLSDGGFGSAGGGGWVCHGLAAMRRARASSRFRRSSSARFSSSALSLASSSRCFANRSAASLRASSASLSLSALSRSSSAFFSLVSFAAVAVVVTKVFCMCKLETARFSFALTSAGRTTGSGSGSSSIWTSPCRSRRNKAVRSGRVSRTLSLLCPQSSHPSTPPDSSSLAVSSPPVDSDPSAPFFSDSPSPSDGSPDWSKADGCTAPGRPACIPSCLRLLRTNE
mmetsp:Transcript_21540/g.51003  ORF Transcript_21540/g.51003 Transcript_21540/m.51003 type:complete len:250 (-) Transcript_21540:400-1149(-)